MSHSVSIGLSFMMILSVSTMIYADEYDETIPPEILSQYDPGVVSKQRPVVVRITQAMIFSLRSTPDLGGDVYSFDMDVSKISSVQVDIIKKWVIDGHKILLWGESEGRSYTSLFSDAVEFSSIYLQQCSLSRHMVNTDVLDIHFEMSDRSRFQTSIISKYPADTEVIASTKSGVIAGRVPYGQGSIYFAFFGSMWPSGADKARWTLNFQQWMLGLHVPGYAERQVSSSPAQQKKNVEPEDRILLKNGDAISGRLQFNKITIKTSYAELSFQRDQVERIILEGSGQNIEMVLLRSGDKLSGVVSLQIFRIKLATGQEFDIQKEKIKDIILHD